MVARALLKNPANTHHTDHLVPWWPSPPELQKKHTPSLPRIGR